MAASNILRRLPTLEGPAPSIAIGSLIAKFALRSPIVPASEVGSKSLLAEGAVYVLVRTPDL